MSAASVLYASQFPLAARHVADPGTTDGLAALDRIGAVTTLQRDETLFEAGDAANAYFRVLKGTVRSCRLLADGRRHIDDFFFAGDFIGLDAGEAYAFVAEAVAETTLICYSRRLVERLAAEDTRIAQGLLEAIRSGLTAARERMVLLGHMTAMERMASFLLAMSYRAGGRINLVMTRTDIGDYLGLTMETVSRALSQLRSDGILVQRSMHEFAIADHAALVALTRP
jgi:CRP/FNR family nitrogen fixation transcriptional regulator